MGSLRVNGSTSGYVDLAAPAIAGSTSLTLPAINGTVMTVPNANSASVITDQTTTSTSYTDLTTSGPSITVTTGTRALVVVSFRGYVSVDGYQAVASFTVSGATTLAVDDIYAVWANGFNSWGAQSRVTLLTNLTAGSNTFTLKYKSSGGSSTAHFADRVISVVDLGS